MATHDVQRFYDTHPINVDEVLSKLRDDGKDLAALQPQDLTAYDQDHYGGLEATDALVARLGLTAEMRVLDVCAGLGGTSRYLAWRYGCRVVGVEWNAGRVAGAQELTRRVGLEQRVTFVQGDATALEAAIPAPERGFDAVVSQEAFLHIPDKPALLRGCCAMLRAGGRLGFTDLLATPALTATDRERLADAILAVSLIPAAEYEAHLREAGFREVTWEDLTPWWGEILRGRLEMYRSLEAETVARFGRERHDGFVAGYAHFVEAIESGRLGGGRFIATR